jgi:hypothetical protein
MTHILDRPVWAALAGRHAGFAEGDGLAKRYRPDVIPFAAARDDSPSVSRRSPPCPSLDK